MARRITLLLLALTACGLLLIPPSVTAQQEQICFNNIPGVASCIRGRFAEFWRQNGGLPVFGYPLTGELQELNEGRTFTVQYFERNRFEYHPENFAPYDVLLGRLGATRLQQQGRDWQSFPRSSGAPGERCWFSSNTGKSVCGDFYDYFRSHGLEFDGNAGFSEAESIALFGLPISEPQVETNSGGATVLTQWFERARFEFHPNNPAEFRVLLGLLGNETFQAAQPTPTPTPAPTLTPTPTPRDDDDDDDDDDDNGPEWTTQTGPITALDPNGYFIMNSNQGDWGVYFGGETNIIRENGERASPAELYVGRQVLARGPIEDGNQIRARTIRLYGAAPVPTPTSGSNPAPAPPSTVPGVILAVDRVNQNFAMQSTLDTAIVGVRYTSNTVIVLDNGQPASPANLVPGVWLTAAGGVEGGALTAGSLVLRRGPPTLRRDAELITLDGAVIEPIPALNMFSFTLADGRKFLVVYGGYTNFAKASGGRASPRDLTPGRPVQLRVQLDPIGALVARSVKIFN